MRLHREQPVQFGHLSVSLLLRNIRVNIDYIYKILSLSRTMSIYLYRDEPVALSMSSTISEKMCNLTSSSCVRSATGSLSLFPGDQNELMTDIKTLNESSPTIVSAIAADEQLIEITDTDFCPPQQMVKLDCINSA